MNAYGTDSWVDWLWFGMEIVIQVFIALLIALLGVWMWPSEMVHMRLKVIPLGDWVMTAGSALIVGLGGVILFFAIADLARALRSGPGRRQ
jgi:hypothetical protein